MPSHSSSLPSSLGYRREPILPKRARLPQLTAQWQKGENLLWTARFKLWYSQSVARVPEMLSRHASVRIFRMECVSRLRSISNVPQKLCAHSWFRVIAHSVFLLHAFSCPLGCEKTRKRSRLPSTTSTKHQIYQASSQPSVKPTQHQIYQSTLA